jgi:hypothetical protein
MTPEELKAHDAKMAIIAAEQKANPKPTTPKPMSAGVIAGIAAGSFFGFILLMIIIVVLGYAISKWWRNRDTSKAPKITSKDDSK